MNWENVRYILNQRLHILFFSLNKKKGQTFSSSSKFSCFGNRLKTRIIRKRTTKGSTTSNTPSKITRLSLFTWKFRGWIQNNVLIFFCNKNMMVVELVLTVHFSRISYPSQMNANCNYFPLSMTHHLISRWNSGSKSFKPTKHLSIN